MRGGRELAVYIAVGAVYVLAGIVEPTFLVSGAVAALFLLVGTWLLPGLRRPRG